MYNKHAVKYISIYKSRNLRAYSARDDHVISYVCLSVRPCRPVNVLRILRALAPFNFTSTMSMDSKREKHFLYNSLSILLKAVEKERTIVDLRNESSIFGIVEQTDAYVIFFHF